MSTKQGAKRRKIGRNKKKPTSQRYLSERRWISNGKKREEKHKKRLERDQESKKRNNSLVQGCVDKYSLPQRRARYVLKRLLGELSKHKLESLLSGPAMYKKLSGKRYFSPNAYALIRSTGELGEFVR